MVPKHVAIILDGNGRWAKERGKMRSQGHLAGADNLETIYYALMERGVSYLTVYAFSTENWKRSEEEVSFLMSLLKTYLIRNKKDAIRDKTRIRVIGNRSMLSQDFRDLIEDVEEATKDFTHFTLTFAISYGSRDEIVRGVKALGQDLIDGKASVETIDEAMFSSYLDTGDLPDPDLLIRPGGEERLSNFLLWQLAYSEFIFSPKYWPDFSVEDLDNALAEFEKRDRRYGGRK